MEESLPARPPGLRTSYRDTIEFAKVVGDRIVSDDGTPLTPSLFANRSTNGRNA
jgi:hypothetical protein